MQRRRRRERSEKGEWVKERGKEEGGWGGVRVEWGGRRKGKEEEGERRGGGEC